MSDHPTEQVDRCAAHDCHARCPDCGAEYNIPKGYVLVSERDVMLLNAATEWSTS